MENDGSRDESVAEGLIDAVASANRESRPERANSDPAATGATGPQNARTETQKEKQAQKNEAEVEEDAGDNADGLDTQDFSRDSGAKDDTTDDTTTATGDDATSQNETETSVDDEEWRKELPYAPGEFTLEAPVPDELGRVDPDEYTNYLEAKIEHKAAIRAYNTAVITKSFEAAEKILPELKTNVVLQNLVKQTFLADLRDGKQDANPVTVARALKDAFDTKSAEGASNAKTQVTIQKVAAVETKGAAKPKSATSKKDADFDRRLARGDTAALEDLMGQWIDEKKV
jgi:hypothetical protein